MSKEAKYTVYFVGFLCLLIFIAGIFSGCESKGVQGFIYHDKELVTKTICNDDLFVSILPDTIIVKSKYRGSYGLYDKDIYKYINDGKYTIERKECIQ